MNSVVQISDKTEQKTIGANVHTLSLEVLTQCYDNQVSKHEKNHLSRKCLDYFVLCIYQDEILTSHIHILHTHYAHTDISDKQNTWRSEQQNGAPNKNEWKLISSSLQKVKFALQFRTVYNLFYSKGELLIIEMQFLHGMLPMQPLHEASTLQGEFSDQFQLAMPKQVIHMPLMSTPVICKEE